MAKFANRVFNFEEGPRESPKLTAKAWQKMKDQRTLEAVSIYGPKKANSRPAMAQGAVNP
ncbi:MAG: hypothetical protein LUQ38_11910 [Methanotrichaceae archaeon]|nr:hypothetical protein [Methanotrichaceae archaeon]MDD1758307.1 hypothetical protein [Methanotrichaceae archaeon]